MIKAVAKTNSGPLIILGISDANMDRIRKNDPIVFNLRDLGLSDRWVCVSCKRPDGTAVFPVGMNFIGLAFKPKMFRKMQRKPVEISDGNYRFILFRGKDESSMAEEMRSLIGVNTTVKDSRPPSAKDPGRN